MKRMCGVLAIMFVLLGATAYASGSGEGAATGPAQPLEITFMNTVHASLEPFGPQHGLYQEILKRLNVKLNMINIPDGDYVAKKTLIFASGEYPDLFRDAPSNLATYIRDGVVVPLNDLMSKYGPNMAKVLQDDIIRYSFSDDEGNIVGAPFVGEPAWTGGEMIREDWLKQYNLKMPSTFDEFYQVLRTFKEKDPAGGGKTIPFSTRFNFYIGMWNEFGYTEPISWDLTAKTYIVGVTTPAYRDALAFLNKLYKEGLLDQEYLTNTTALWQQKVSAGQVGAFHDNLARRNWLNTIFVQADAKTTKMVEFMPPLPDSKGKRYHRLGWDLSRAAAITKVNKHPVETMKFLDYFYSPEGSTVLNFGIEGTHYKVENGKKVLLVTPDDLAKKYYATGGNFWPGVRSLEYNDVTDPSFGVNYRFIQQWGSRDSIAPPIRITPAENDAIKEVKPAVTKYVDENTNKFIMGTRPLTEWNDYVKKVEELGVGKLLKINLDALARYNKMFGR
jgi:putative aldouronate transport system substrate-binding protein